MRMEKAFKSEDVFIIAEAGVNHNGSVELAKKLVDAAVKSGADAVKFQMYDSQQLVSREATLAGYQQQKGYQNQLQMLQQFELSPDQFEEVKAYCDRAGIMFLATPFDLQSAQRLFRMKVEAFKVGSGDITYFPLLKHLRQYEKPILLSTGMSTLGEVEASLSCLSNDVEVALFHCTSSYPAPLEDVHLNVLHSFKTAFSKSVGYSDHTQGIEIPIAASAMGYCWIEKHLTLDRKMQGPDHAASIEPEEFQQMVLAIRNVKCASGKTIKQPAPSEIDTQKKVRRGIYVEKDLSAGHLITEKDLMYLRPEKEISSSAYENILGRELRHGKKAFEALQWNDIIR